MTRYPPLNRLTLYTRRLPEMVAFYSTHFGYEAFGAPNDRIVELRPPGAGVTLNLHPLAKSQKEGQVLVKLSFEVADVEAFIREAASKGLTFGKPFKGDGYLFANTKDPAKNSVAISSRAHAGLTLRPLGPDDIA